MASFVVEVYAPNLSRADLGEVAERAHAAAREMELEGILVRYLRSVLVPEDETCFHHFDGPTIEAIRRASERAGLLSEDRPGSVKRSLQVER
jgi:Nickel responsive protein SCO4226-like